MDPILATGIATLGKSLADKILPGAGNLVNMANGAKNGDFSALLQAANTVNATSSISSTELEALRKEFQLQFKQLKESQLIPGQFFPQGDEEIVTISLNKKNQYILTNSLGQKMEVSADSELGKMFEQLLQTKNMILEQQGLKKASTLHLAKNAII